MSPVSVSRAREARGTHRLAARCSLLLPTSLIKTYANRRSDSSGFGNLPNDSCGAEQVTSDPRLLTWILICRQLMFVLLCPLFRVPLHHLLYYKLSFIHKRRHPQHRHTVQQQCGTGGAEHPIHQTINELLLYHKQIH